MKKTNFQKDYDSMRKVLNKLLTDDKEHSDLYFDEKTTLSNLEENTDNWYIVLQSTKYSISPKIKLWRREVGKFVSSIDIQDKDDREHYAKTDIRIEIANITMQENILLLSLRCHVRFEDIYDLYGFSIIITQGNGNMLYSLGYTDEKWEQFKLQGYGEFLFRKSSNDNKYLIVYKEGNKNLNYMLDIANLTLDYVSSRDMGVEEYFEISQLKIRCFVDNLIVMKYFTKSQVRLDFYKYHAGAWKFTDSYSHSDKRGTIEEISSRMIQKLNFLT